MIKEKHTQVLQETTGSPQIQLDIDAAGLGDDPPP